MLLHLVFHNNFRPSTASHRESFMLQDAGDVVSFSMWKGQYPRAPGVWLIVEIEVCRPTLLRQDSRALPCLSAADRWLPRQHAIADDSMGSSRGLLGYLSSAKMELIESLFGIMGEPGPWGSMINPL